MKGAMFGVGIIKIIQAWWNRVWEFILFRAQAFRSHTVTVKDLESALPLFQKYKGDIVAISEKRPLKISSKGIGCALLQNFAGKPSVVMEGVRVGCFFSFPLAVCRNKQLIKQIPLERICLETDSPALGPDRYVRNEPKNTSLVWEYVAPVRRITPEKVMEATSSLLLLQLFTGSPRLGNDPEAVLRVYNSSVGGHAAPSIIPRKNKVRIPTTAFGVPCQ
ncbi:putative deoxyribonuclease TATDN3 [Arapaima gigas]